MECGSISLNLKVRVSVTCLSFSFHVIISECYFQDNFFPK